MSAQNLEDLTPEQIALPLVEASMIGPEFDALSPEVAAKIASWRPRKVGPEDAEALEVVLPSVRSWVSAARPDRPDAAAQLLWAVIQLAIWWYKRFRKLDAAEVLTDHNIEHFTMHVNAHRPASWRHTARSSLRRVGRAVNPDLWPLKHREVGHRGAVPPYSPQEEERFTRLALLPGRLNYSGRAWVVAATFGAGLMGYEATTTTVDDLTESDDGRIIVTVRGDRARRVPIRRDYTAMAREAIKTAHGTSFFRGTSPRGATKIADYISKDLRKGGCSEGLSLSRARNTWIVAHLTANTRFEVLRAVGGPISAKTLLSLVQHAQAEISMDEAVEAALSI